MRDPKAAESQSDARACQVGGKVETILAILNPDSGQGDLSMVAVRLRVLAAFTDCSVPMGPEK